MPRFLLACRIAIAVALFADGALANVTVTEAEARRGCPPVHFPTTEGGVTGCALGQFGALGTFDGHRFVYAVYTPLLDGGGRGLGERVVVYEREADSGLRADIVVGQENVDYDKPEILRLPDRVVLKVWGRVGTAALDESELFVWRRGAWAKLDTTSWLDDLARRLPGYSAWWGVFPDYRRMTGAVHLGRSGDSICCPSGGRADVVFAWRGDRLVIKSLRAKLGAKYAAF